MTWDRVAGHERLVEQFRAGLRRGRLASTFLFVGPPGVGKRTFARQLAQALLCEAAPQPGDSCGRCPACQQAAAGTHPDLEIVSKPPDKSFIPIEAFIGDREHRMREGLCRRISLKPYRGGRKVALIEDADDLNQEGANCLLKLLEEPPPQAVLVLIGVSEHRQPATVRSRCQIVRFLPLPPGIVAELLVSRGLVEDPAEAARLASVAEGSLQRAVELLDPSWRQIRGRILELLGAGAGGLQTCPEEVAAAIDEAGKEAFARRARLRQVMGGAAEFYRELMRTLGGAEPGGDQHLTQAVSAARAWWSGDAETAAACVERCLDAQQEVQRNANQATLLQCWLHDLSQIARPGR